MARRFIGFVLALVALIVGAPSSGAALQGAPISAIYTYDATVHSALAVGAATERSPPVAYDHNTTYDAVDRWSPGASTRPSATTRPAGFAYDDLDRFARTTGGRSAEEHGGGAEAVSVVLQRSEVAAKSARVFRSGGAAAGGGGISLEQAASAASRNGIDVRMMQLAHEAGGPGYGFTSYTMSGAPFRAANGRFLVTLTDRGLASEADAVNTIAHELNHLREAMRTGMPIVEEGPAIRSGNLAEEFFR